jgi:catechol 2,3-dioxygenase-like lactoylglutathione lyase family enzyme
MMFKEANVTVMVSDMDRAVAFYRDTLGLTPGRRYGNEWADFDANGIKIGLHPGGKKPLTEPSRHMQIGFAVDDLDAVTKAMTAKGVSFTRVADKGSRVCNFTDPDGNPLYLIELKWG